MPWKFDCRGQKEVLAALGFTEESMGCPIVSSMETVSGGVNPDGKEIFIDRHAAEADGIILSCRVKPHTAFRGKYESGILKMLAIGLAKQKGAELTHDEGVGNLAKNIRQNGLTIIHNFPCCLRLRFIEMHMIKHASKCNSSGEIENRTENAGESIRTCAC